MLADNGQYIPVEEGATDLAELFGEIRSAATKLGPAVQSVTNDIANLRAQNSDIAAGRWTMNNAVYQWSLLDPLGKAAVIAGAWFIGRHFLRG